MSEKTVLVTGGTSGIGKNISIQLFLKGYKVIIMYKNNTESAHHMLETYNIEGYQVDLKNYEDISIVVDKIIHKYGKIDILVNNAGILVNKLFTHMKPVEWVDIINNNLISVMNVTHCVIPNMINQKAGKVINIGSVSGLTGYKGQCAYGASKTGIIGFSKSLAKEVSQYDIHVNIINPGFIQTNILEGISLIYKEKIKKTIPVRHFGSCDNVFSVVDMLINNNYITGSIITVDGGLTC